MSVSASVVIPCYNNNNKHCCVLSNSGLSNATSKRPKLAFFRGKICPPQSQNCQNRNSAAIRTPLKFMSTSGLSHKQQASSRPHFRAVRPVLWKMVKNCVYIRSRPDEIDTETEVCTYLKSEFYFRFSWPPSTKSTLISYISVGVFVTICGKTCPPQWRNWNMGILHTSKIGHLLPVCLKNNRHLADHIFEPYA